MTTLPASSERPQPVRFTAHFHQVISSCVHLLGASLLSYCLSRRTPFFGLGCWKRWVNLTWGRLCVILVLLDSWLFVFVSGVLVNGVGLSYSSGTCALAIYACISFYALSKVLIYGFLVEKVYIVWSGGNHTPRFSTPAYRICSVVLLGYVAILVLMIVGKTSLIRTDGMCMIGLKDFATYSMIAYDLSLNLFLTGMFLWPLWRTKFISPRLRNIATRTLCGAFASLTTSAANVAILTGLRGEEYGWACLASCVTDVTLNAVVLAWVTAGSDSNVPVDRFSIPTMDVGPLSLAGNDGEQSRRPIHHEESTLQPTISQFPLSLPESYYDYIPRDQLSEANNTLVESRRQRDANAADQEWGFVRAWRRIHDSWHFSKQGTEMTDATVLPCSRSEKDPDLVQETPDGHHEGEKGSCQTEVQEKDICDR